MSDPSNCPSRRQFLKTAALAAAAAPLAGVFASRTARADSPHVDAANDATAKALGYTEDAATAKDKPNFKPDSACHNCTFYKGAAGADFGPCDLFPGKAVSAKGWCMSWSKKA